MDDGIAKSDETLKQENLSNDKVKVVQHLGIPSCL